MRKITMKGAWKLGYRARLDGRPVSANPFEPQRAIFESWTDGWWAAQASQGAGRSEPAPLSL